MREIKGAMPTISVWIRWLVGFRIDHFDAAEATSCAGSGHYLVPLVEILLFRTWCIERVVLCSHDI